MHGQESDLLFRRWHCTLPWLDHEFRSLEAGSPAFLRQLFQISSGAARVGLKLYRRRLAIAERRKWRLRWPLLLIRAAILCGGVCAKTSCCRRRHRELDKITSADCCWRVFF